MALYIYTSVFRLYDNIFSYGTLFCCENVKLAMLHDPVAEIYTNNFEKQYSIPISNEHMMIKCNNIPSGKMYA